MFKKNETKCKCMQIFDVGKYNDKPQHISKTNLICFILIENVKTAANSTTLSQLKSSVHQTLLEFFLCLFVPSLTGCLWQSISYRDVESFSCRFDQGHVSLPSLERQHTCPSSTPAFFLQTELKPVLILHKSNRSLFTIINHCFLETTICSQPTSDVCKNQ